MTVQQTARDHAARGEEAEVAGGARESSVERGHFDEETPPRGRSRARKKNIQHLVDVGKKGGTCQHTVRGGTQRTHGESCSIFDIVLDYG